MPSELTLSEHDSKALLAHYGMPVTREVVVGSPHDAVVAARSLGYPVVVKLCGAAITHKTELGGVLLGIADDEAAEAAATDLLERGPAGAEILVAEQITGARELIAGVTHDPQFGLTLMFGVGGVFAELLGDVVFRLLPASEIEIEMMFDDLDNSDLLGEFRGDPAVDRTALLAALAALARCALEEPDVVSIDVNPLIVAGASPVAVDALVVKR